MSARLQSLTITLRGIERSGAIEARVREIGDRLQRCHGRITHCHVTVVGGLDEAAAAGYSSTANATICAKIHLSVPGAQIHADSFKADGTEHTDVFLALRDAYDSARRQLRDLARDESSTKLVSALRGSTGR